FNQDERTTNRTKKGRTNMKNPISLAPTLSVAFPHFQPQAPAMLLLAISNQHEPLATHPALSQLEEHRSSTTDFSTSTSKSDNTTATPTSLHSYICIAESDRKQTANSRNLEHAMKVRVVPSTASASMLLLI